MASWRYRKTFRRRNEICFTGFTIRLRRPEELLEKYRDLMKGIASLEFLAGFCYTQLTDIEQEINGLLTYDRKPKVPAEAIAAIHEEMFRKR